MSSYIYCCCCFCLSVNILGSNCIYNHILMNVDFAICREYLIHQFRRMKSLGAWNYISQAGESELVYYLCTISLSHQVLYCGKRFPVMFSTH